MSNGDCLFCKIAKGELSADVVLDRDGVIAFRDINPQAPTHVLVIPAEHIASLEMLGDHDAALLASIVSAINEVARNEGVAGGFRVVTNIGPAAGQSVDHLHFHILGGRPMRWPPG
jgi:histidine triad (HIT) family protein